MESEHCCRGKAIRVMNQTYDELKLEQHPDKTLIGRTELGFDFLGYHFTPDELSVAGKTIEKLKKRIARLYEEGADSLRIGECVSRWAGWVKAGLGGSKKMKRTESQMKFCPDFDRSLSLAKYQISSC